MWESTEDHVRWVMEWEEPGNISLTHLLEVAKSLQLFINQGHYHPVASLVKGELQRKRTKGKRPSGGGSLVQENHAGIAQTREQVLPLQQEFLILLVSRVLCSERCKGLNWNAS